MSNVRVLCVAEKPTIARQVSGVLSGGSFRTRNGKSKYNKNFEFTYNFGQWGYAQVVMTSVSGHLLLIDFPSNYGWDKVTPGRLFEAPITEVVPNDKKDIYNNIKQEARFATILMIWTDCDREGEYIGWEIVKAAQEGNPRIQIETSVFRSQFSHLERNHVIHAANNPISLNMKAVDAVACRQEIDLRVGLSFTRLLSRSLGSSRVIEPKTLISYGTCQFPTLGFIVDRYKRVKSFVPEQFWYIKVTLKKNDQMADFHWTRGNIFDRLFPTLVYSDLLARFPQGGKVQMSHPRPTSKWKPLPLTTVILQKDCSVYFKMSAKATLDAAEKLYQSGWLLYPRTETDVFPDAMDLHSLIQNQTQSPIWGSYALELLNDGKFDRPRAGKNNDQAHPPIHPVVFVSTDVLRDSNQRNVYEYVVRRFLASCSRDAKGEQTKATFEWGHEKFVAEGVMVKELNYLEVYKYQKWESSKQLPQFENGELIKPFKHGIFEGKTSPPQYMTEAELILLMDANGIGTDATIAEHITKIIDRQYVSKTKVGRGGPEVLVPSWLGMGLIDGFDSMEFDDISLSKPFLRKDLEVNLSMIVSGSKTKQDVLTEFVTLYKRAYATTNSKLPLLNDSCRRCRDLTTTQASTTTPAM
ncbi:DNA topoisomerase [Scheffersomyces spartinae]|uniref:DNA topoisomerase n=1 Tax=Scheffersomyces spartinae TaxID=45513 RepID=A0A9P7VCL0_9ASCO|nr:DNA topoisomerase [Scheffersomyces spartinae]KAG7195628.1 DNA topoisomerase [Scheffersomyces spartinae]